MSFWTSIPPSRGYAHGFTEKEFHKTLNMNTAECLFTPDITHLFLCAVIHHIHHRSMNTSPKNSNFQRGLKQNGWSNWNTIMSEMMTNWWGVPASATVKQKGYNLWGLNTLLRKKGLLCCPIGIKCIHAKWSKALMSDGVLPTAVN